MRGAIDFDTAFTLPITPQPEDFDELGHVNNVTYLRWTQDIATTHWRTIAGPELQETYVPNMISGHWGGTMCLTEPQAGSSLSDIVASAKPMADGSYRISGQKIFISAGDNQFSENIIHLLLARIEGAPAGTKGISLFVVPKNRIQEDGSLTPNDVTTVADFQKMGQRGYATTHLMFGEKEDCHGFLVGEANEGLRYMFQMMNEARIAVGMHATGMATAAYHASLEYARERRQGRKITAAGVKDVQEEQTLIMNHPDVRRMLLTQKAITEGGASLVIQCARYGDLAEAAEGEDKAKYHLLLELLTPIAKTYPTEKGKEAIDAGLQVLGGYGFCMDFPLQQYYRDIRITSLYEGTTGIQSLDLLGRKMTMKNGKAAQLLMAEMAATIAEAETYDDLKPWTAKLKQHTKKIQEVMMKLMPHAMQGDYERFLADATVFMQYSSIIIVAWQWLKMGTHAKKALVTGKGDRTEAFYESKLHTMKFYFQYELPQANGLFEVLTAQDEQLTIVNEKEVIS